MSSRLYTAELRSLTGCDFSGSFSTKNAAVTLWICTELGNCMVLCCAAVSTGSSPQLCCLQSQRQLQTRPGCSPKKATSQPPGPLPVRGLLSSHNTLRSEQAPGALVQGMWGCKQNFQEHFLSLASRLPPHTKFFQIYKHALGR